VNPIDNAIYPVFGSDPRRTDVEALWESLEAEKVRKMFVYS